MVFHLIAVPRRPQRRHRFFDEPRFSRRVPRNNDRGFPLTRPRFNRFIAFFDFIGFDPTDFPDKSAQIVCKLFNYVLKTAKHLFERNKFVLYNKKS